MLIVKIILGYISLLSQTTATDGAGPSGTGQDGTTRAATRQDGEAGGREEEEVGEGGKAGSRGTWEQLRRRGRRRKGASGNTEGRTAAEDEADVRASNSEQRPGNMAVVPPPPWLFGQGVDIFFPKSNAVK